MYSPCAEQHSQLRPSQEHSGCGFGTETIRERRITDENLSLRHRVSTRRGTSLHGAGVRLDLRTPEVTTVGTTGATASGERSRAGRARGYRIGLSDAKKGHRFEFEQHDAYRDADKGYNRRDGDRDGYRESFRKGFVPKVTFDDVAGIDEAESELIEIVDFLEEPVQIPAARRHRAESGLHFESREFSQPCGRIHIPFASGTRRGFLRAQYHCADTTRSGGSAAHLLR